MYRLPDSVRGLLMEEPGLISRPISTKSTLGSQVPIIYFI